MDATVNHHEFRCDGSLALVVACGVQLKPWRSNLRRGIARMKDSHSGERMKKPRPATTPAAKADETDRINSHKRPADFLSATDQADMVPWSVFATLGIVSG